MVTLRIDVQIQKVRFGENLNRWRQTAMKNTENVHSKRDQKAVIHVQDHRGHERQRPNQTIEIGLPSKTDHFTNFEEHRP